MDDIYALGEPEVLLQGQFIEMVRRPFYGGDWEYTRRRGNLDVVFVLAITPANEVLLIRQFRVPMGAEVWELPAGVGDHEGEDLIECGMRELVEETGWRARRAELLLRSPVSAGASSVRGDIVLARDLEYVGRSGGDEYFPIEVARVPLGDVVSFIEQRTAAGELVDARILAALKLAEARGVCA